ncbi:MAG TPA: vanadium-dependent haloperoxidase [Gemmatimonadota bacterium]|nr:vanadium-dependent haloperoxidase [Gemmatimonadota bacterium]
MNRVQVWRRSAPAAFLLAVVLSAGCESSSPTDTAGPAPGVESFDAEVAIAWLRLTIDLTRDEGLFPPSAARAYGYVGVTLWEAVAPGVPGGRSLAGRLNALGPVPTASPDLHWPAVANAALAEIARRLYTSPGSQGAIDDLEAAFRERFRSDVRASLLERSAEHGRSVAVEIWDWSLGDGYGVLANCPYLPTDDPARWRPTPPGFEGPVEACWGQMRPLLLGDPGECAAGAHPPYSEEPGSEFHRQAMEVYETVRDATPEQRTIALFWADLAGESGTPAGHSLSITAQALEGTDARLDRAAEAFARVGIGESDAFIACWAAKYHYNLLRPITYIRALIDPAWESVLETPPFPAHPSGHSNDAGASSTILTAIFGDGFAFTDHTNDPRGFAPRSFGSFFEAAEESAFSRLYGGIHYRFDIELGLEQGRCVGRAVNALEFRAPVFARSAHRGD